MVKSNVKVLPVSENNYESHAAAVPRKIKEASFTDIFKCKTKSTNVCKKNRLEHYATKNIECNIHSDTFICSQQGL